MKSSASRTARGVALIRAIEMRRPAEERITADPYAAAFVSPAAIQSMRLVNRLGVWRLIGVEQMVTFALLRERFIEELMRREAGRELEQVVVLGAGFDTRAYRMPELAGIPIFEVDHPSTQVAKRDALRGVVDPLPPCIHMVAVDFNTDDLGQRLRSAGYDPLRRTLFVWQGVIMYLTPEGIDATLRFIAGQAVENSVLVFDAMQSNALSSGSPLRLMTAMMGERLTFTIDSDMLPSFLAQRGLELMETVDGTALRSRVPEAHRRPVATRAMIAVARVPAAGSFEA